MHTVWTEKVHWLISTKKMLLHFLVFVFGLFQKKTTNGTLNIVSTYATLKGNVTNPDYFFTIKSLNE